MEKETIKPEKKKKTFNKRKLKYGVLATVVTIVFIAFIVFLNLIAGIMTERKDLKLDLTEQQYYEVSQETIDYVKGISKDVEIAVMAKKSSFETGTYMKMVLETLEKYQQNSEHIELNFYDVASNPDVITRYQNIYNGEISEGDIVISTDERVKVLDINNLFNIETNSYGSSSITGYNGEQEITSAVMSVTDSNPIKVAFASQYNGSAIYHTNNASSISALYSLMDSNGYELTQVDIMTDELSTEDYDMLVLPAPIYDLTEDCIDKLDTFLYNDGNLDKDLIYLADVYQFATPNIDAFLEVWGIDIGDSIVYESDQNNSQYVTISEGAISAPIVTIGDETYSEGLSNTTLPIVFPRSRPVELLFDANVDRTTSALLTTSDTAFLYPLEMQDAEEALASAENGEEATEAETEEETEETTEFNPDDAEKSSANVMAVATKTNMDSNNTAHVNNVMVIGGTAVLDQYLTASSTYNNAEYVINAVNQMCGKESGIVIASKDFSITSIDITSSQIKTISRVVIFIIPLIVIIIGIAVFLRRRNR